MQEELPRVEVLVGRQGCRRVDKHLEQLVRIDLVRGELLQVVGIDRRVVVLKEEDNREHQAVRAEQVDQQVVVPRARR